jgi:DNA-binding NarL/FixJ family response regulator
MAVDGGFASEAIGAGAAGYVLKDMADAELVDAILAAVRGESYVSALVAARLQAQARADPRELGAVETDVLRLIALGRRDPEIGLELGLGELALEACRADIHRRLGIASRSELSRYALRHGLLAHPDQPERPGMRQF